MIDSFWNPGDQILVWALNVVLQAGLVAALATLIGMALRRSSAARYWLLCSALMVVMACPMLTAVVQSSGLSLISLEMIAATPHVQEVQPEEVSVAPRRDESRQNQISDVSVVPPVALTEIEVATFGPPDRQVPYSVTESVESTSVVPASEPALTPITPPSPSAMGRVLHAIGPPLVSVWALVAAVLLMRLFIQWHRLSLLLQSAKLNTDEAFANTFQAACTALGIRPNRVPTLVLSSDVSGPIAAGIRSPKVVLPAAFVRQINSEQLREIIIHEVAHIVRGGQLVVLLQNIMGAVFWMHPLVRLLNRQLAKAREEVCDNYVLATTDAPSYSRTLLTLAQLLNSPRQVPGAVGLFTSRWKLEHRVAGLLDQRRNRVTRLSRPAFALIGILSLVLAMTAAIATMSLATASPNDEAKTTAERNPDEVVALEAVASDNVVIVRGTVLKPDGSPAAGATIRAGALVYAEMRGVLGKDFESTIKEVVADENGRFEISIERKPYGELPVEGTKWEDFWKRTIICATVHGFGGQWKLYKDVEGVDTVTLQLVEDAPIRGRVIGLEGQPVSGVTIEVKDVLAPSSESLDAWLQAVRNGEPAWVAVNHISRQIDSRMLDVPKTVTSDRDGAFEIRGLGRERVIRLHAHGNGIAFADFQVATRPLKPLTWNDVGRSDSPASVYGAEFTLTGHPSRTVNGTLTDAKTGMLLAGVDVAVTKMSGKNIGGRWLLPTKTDPQGQFRIDGIPKGEGNSLMFRPTDDQPYFMRELDVPDSDGMDPIVVDVELHRGIWIEGKVVDKQLREPVAGVRIHYLPFLTNKFAVELPEFDRGNVDGNQDRYQTDANGKYRLVGLPGAAIVGAESIHSPFRAGVGYDELTAPKCENGWVETYRNPINPGPKWPDSMVQIDPGAETQSIRLDFELDSGASVEVSVVDESDNFIIGAEVNGLTSGYGPTEITEAKPYVASCLAPGEDRVIFVHHEEKRIGQVARIGDEQISNGRMQIRLQPCATVTGRLTDEEKPLTGISIDPRILPDVDFSKALPRFTTDTDGVFTGTLLPGCQYKLFATGSRLRYGAILADDLAVEPGQKIDLGTLTLTKDGKFVKAIVQAGEQTTQPLSASP